MYYTYNSNSVYACDIYILNYIYIYMLHIYIKFLIYIFEIFRAYASVFVLFY